MSTNRQPDSKPTVRENDIFRGAHKYRLDQPLAVQIWRYVVSIVTRFDFGPSFHYKDQSVNEIIRQGFPVTLTYGAWSFAVAVLVGITLGVAAAVFHNSLLDYLAVGVSIGAQVLPNFVMTPLLTLVFTLWLGWLPGGGWQGGHWPYVIMPVIALSTSFMASIARLTRNGMDASHPLIPEVGRVEVDPRGPTASKCQEGRASSSQANRRVRDED